MELWVFSLICMASIFLGGVISIVFLQPIALEFSDKLHERRRKKIRDEATKGMTELEKMAWDLFN